jgi:F-type H+-transporting ATPase subunit delta
MTPNAAARQYANALFDVAAKNGSVDRVRQDLSAFADLIRSHADLAKVLLTPTVPIARKRGVVDALATAAGDMTGEARRVLGLLADRDRLGILDEVIAAFTDRSMAADRVVTAEVTSAAPLDAAPKAALIAALSQAVGRQVTMTERVDPALIGGVVAKVGSLVFDGSVTRQLERIRQKLVAEA